MSPYRDFATSLSQKAGEIIKDAFTAGVKREWKKDNTPVTDVDKEINTLVINSITKVYPGYAILGEEESNLTESEYVWVCDPIDGTVPFSHGFPLSVFTLALVYKGEVILGVINDPYLNRFMIAEKGKGTFLNGKQVFVSDTNEMKHAVIDVETWSTSLYDLTPLYTELISRKAMPTTLRSAVYVGMLIAMGELGGIYFGGKTPWDAAAVKIVVEEAGGTVTDIFGNDQRYDKDINGFIAGNKKLHNELVSIAKIFR
jgi:myo-inositol-1(or 4)-monophosphatase